MVGRTWIPHPKGEGNRNIRSLYVPFFTRCGTMSHLTAENPIPRKVYRLPSRAQAKDCTAPETVNGKPYRNAAKVRLRH